MVKDGTERRNPGVLSKDRPFSNLEDWRYIFPKIITTSKSTLGSLTAKFDSTGNWKLE